MRFGDPALILDQLDGKMTLGTGGDNWLLPSHWNDNGVWLDSAIWRD